MVGVENLCSLILACLTHKNAANRIFLVSDGNDVSTAELIRLLGKTCQCPARLVPCPTWMLLGLGKMTGREQEVRRLIGNLQVSITETCQLLDWHPDRTVEESIRGSV